MFLLNSLSFYEIAFNILDDCSAHVDGSHVFTLWIPGIYSTSRDLVRTGVVDSFALRFVKRATYCQTFLNGHSGTTRLKRTVHPRLHRRC